MSMLSRAKYQNYWFYCDRVTPICLVNTADFRSEQYLWGFYPALSVGDLGSRATRVRRPDRIVG